MIEAKLLRQLLIGQLGDPMRLDGASKLTRFGLIERDEIGQRTSLGPAGAVVRYVAGLAAGSGAVSARVNLTQVPIAT